jgi:hypothetical protein
MFYDVFFSSLFFPLSCGSETSISIRSAPLRSHPTLRRISALHSLWDPDPDPDPARTLQSKQEVARRCLLEAVASD